MKVRTMSRNLKMFLIPSLIGLFLFMTPISFQDSVTIPIAVMAKTLENLLKEHLTLIVTSLVSISALFSLLFTLKEPSWLKKHSFLEDLFVVSKPWLIVKIVGAIFVLISFFKIGPNHIWSDATGGLLLNDLMPVLFSVFIFAGLFLPLLLNFGLLEFIGTLLTKVMRPLFRLPGRAAIDCTTSWLGDGTVGVMLTNRQFEDKIYTQREAAVVGTTFSAVSITFSMVVITQVKLEHLFIPFYLTVCLTGIIVALIIPRIPPLSRKKDIHIDGTPADNLEETIPEGKNAWSYGFELALERASSIKSLKSEVRLGIMTAAEMIFGVLPVVMGIGTIALILAEHTPIFMILGKPFVPFLELLRIPEAAAASGTIVVGFADMFIPSILASSIDSEVTRFTIAALSVTQLIYMSEVGALLLGSKIPVNFIELFVIFLLRTVISLPVIAILAHLIV